MDLFGALLFQIAGQQLPSAGAEVNSAPIRAKKFSDSGLSWRKISTLWDLAERLWDGRLDANALAALADEELIAV